MKDAQCLTAQEFAEEFINDLNESLENTKLEEQNFMFSWQVYEEDKDLTVLKQNLNKIGYDLKLSKKSTTTARQEWQLIKF